MPGKKLPASRRGPFLRKLIEHMLGTARGPQMAIALVMLVLFGAMTNGAYSLTTALLTGAGGLPLWLADLTVIGLFLTVLAWFSYNVRRAASHVRFRVECDAAAPPVRTLCIFLSDLNEPDERQMVAGLVERSAPPEPPDLDKSRWRMPVEALAYHRSKLREVVVVPSPESAARVDLFKRLVERLWPDGTLRVRTLSELGREHADVVPEWQSYEEGIPFTGDITALVRAVDDAERALSAEGVATRELSVDITGGTKLSGVAGVAIALNEGLRFQYVTGSAERGYEVFVYNPSYEAET